MLSGFTLVHNAVKLDFPIVAAIQSLLEACDEVVVNVGASDDGTRDLVTGVDDPRVRIIDRKWEFGIGDEMLAVETQRAMDACRGSWGIYIQADEVLHERGAHVLKEKIAEWDRDERVEGLLVKYLHFYGGFDRIATSRRWYRREARCIRLGRDIRPYQGAQGFRVGSNYRKVRARPTDAEVFHYGWARSARAIKAKLEITKTMYPLCTQRLERELQENGGALAWIPLLQPYRGQHPAVAREWIADQSHRPLIGPQRFKLEHLRFYFSDWIERLTGARVFEFRNYQVV